MMSEILQEPLLTKDSARQFFSILEVVCLAVFKTLFAR